MIPFIIASKIFRKLHRDRKYNSGSQGRRLEGNGELLFIGYRISVL